MLELPVQRRGKQESPFLQPKRRSQLFAVFSLVVQSIGRNERRGGFGWRKKGHSFGASAAIPPLAGILSRVEAPCDERHNRQDGGNCRQGNGDFDSVRKCFAAFILYGLVLQRVGAGCQRRVGNGRNKREDGCSERRHLCCDQDCLESFRSRQLHSQGSDSRSGSYAECNGGGLLLRARRS